MCGIGGYFGPPRDDLPRLADRLLAAMAHRGPDGRGHEIVRVSPDRSLLLVHARLAVIDTSSAGAQPMADAGTSNVISFAGEIYNHEELRARSEARGRRFSSKSDTEALLAAWGEDGPFCLGQAIGMFSFALWDPKRAELCLAVDHAGMKPLYWASVPGGAVVFASEVRALMAAGLVERRADADALTGYLALGSIQAPRTILKGVQAMPPGTWLRVSADGEVRGPWAWWSPTFPERERWPWPADPVHTAYYLDAAVRRHLSSDVPLALLLSGGMDSGAIAALASRHSTDIHAFTVDTGGGADESEAETASAISERCGLNHTIVKIPASECEAWAISALASLDQPSLDGVNTWIVAKAIAEQGFKVALTGTGGDELFGGYATFRQIPVLARWRAFTRLIAPLARAFAEAVDPRIGDLLVNGGDPLKDYLILKGLFGRARADLLDLPARLGCLDEWNAVSLLEMRVYLANMLLRDADFMGMAHGVELRAPILDRHLMEAVCALPGSAKASRFRQKPLLAAALRTAGVESPGSRPKAGFSLPWNRWLRGPLRSPVESAIMDGGLARIGIGPSVGEAAWRGYLRGEPGFRWDHAWALAALGTFAERYHLLV